MDKQILNLSMLYVEDDAATREQLSEVFEQKVETLYVAKNGVEALEIFKNNQIHFIISDYYMPLMNGNDLCRAVKEINPLVSFTLLTAFSDTSLLVDAINSGVDKFLQKPVEAKKLFTLMDSVYEKIVSRFKLEKSNVCLQEAEHIARLSYWDVNLKSKQINFSKEALKLFGVFYSSRSDVSYEELLSKVKEDDKEKFIKIFQKRVFEDEKIDETIVIKDNSDKEIYIHLVAKRWKSSACGNQHIVGLFQDVSHYEMERQRLLEENMTDPVLKIANKRHISIELAKLIKTSKRYGHNIGVIFFDIDNFKAINDKHGHLVADELILELSNSIKTDVRQSDLFGRWGGDEFVIVTNYSSQDATIEFAKKIMNKIFKKEWQCKVHLSISIGISFYKIGDDVHTLLDRADNKMLQSKREGKGRFNY